MAEHLYVGADERESRLPKWAQDLISGLRRRLQPDPQDARRSAQRERQFEELKARNDALTELLECAARGGHKTAQEIMDVIGCYELTLTPRQD